MSASSLREAERGVVGGLLNAVQRLPEVAERLAPEDFVSAEPRVVYRALLALPRDHRPSGPVDMAALLAELERTGDLGTAGGSEGVSDLLLAVSGTAHLRHNVEMVSKAAASRRQVEALRDLLAKAKSGADPRALADEAPARLAAAVVKLSNDGRPALPVFPVEALGAKVAPFVRAVAEAYQVPVELPAFGALATLSAAALKRILVRVRPGWREHVALYVAPVLEPGERKTAALAGVGAPLRDLERELGRKLAPAMLASQRARDDAEARVAALARKAAGAKKDRGAIEAVLREAREEFDRLAQPLSVPRYFADDTTPEALGRVMAENDGRLAIFSSEGGIFETLAGRYANGTPNLDLFLKGWDGAEPWIYDRVGAALRIPEPLLAVCLFVQPDVLASLPTKPGFRGRGLIGRFLYAVPSSRLGSRDVDAPPLPAAAGVAWRQIVERIATLQERRSEHGELVAREVAFSDKALALLLDYAEETEARLGPAGDLRPVSDWAGKHVGTLARISGLLHLADVEGNESRPVREDVVGRVVEIGRALIPHAQEAIRRMGGGVPASETQAERERRDLVEWVAAHPGCTAREVGDGMRRFRDQPERAKRAGGALDALSGEGGPLWREAGQRTARYFVRRAAPTVRVRTSRTGDHESGQSADADSADAPYAHRSDPDTHAPEDDSVEPGDDAERCSGGAKSAPGGEGPAPGLSTAAPIKAEPSSNAGLPPWWQEPDNDPNRYGEAC